MEATPRKNLMCHTDDGRIPIEEWLASLDRKDRARVRIAIDRMEDGNFGDVEPVGRGSFGVKI